MHVSGSGQADSLVHRFRFVALFWCGYVPGPSIMPQKRTPVRLVGGQNLYLWLSSASCTVSGPILA